jgi:hypothetical protein
MGHISALHVRLESTLALLGRRFLLHVPPVWQGSTQTWVSFSLWVIQGQQSAHSVPLGAFPLQLEALLRPHAHLVSLGGTLT